MEQIIIHKKRLSLNGGNFNTVVANTSDRVTLGDIAQFTKARDDKPKIIPQEIQFCNWLINTKGFKPRIANECLQLTLEYQNFEGGGLLSNKIENIENAIKIIPELKEFPAINIAHEIKIINALKLLLQFYTKNHGVYTKNPATIKDKINDKQDTQNQNIKKALKQKENFTNWLINNFSIDIDDANNFCNSFEYVYKATGYNVYNSSETDVGYLIEIIDKTFYFLHTTTNIQNQIKTALYRYKAFLAQRVQGIQKNKYNENIKDICKNTNDAYINNVAKQNVYNNSSQTQDTIRSLERKSFIAWEVEQRGLAYPTASMNSGAIKYIEQKTGELLYNTDVATVRRMIETLPQRSNYDDIMTHYGSQIIFSTLRRFAQFLEETGGHYEPTTVIKYKRGEATKRIQKATVIHIKKHDLFNDEYSKEECERCKMILSQSFPHGYLLGDAIDEMNFIDCYEKELGGRLDTEDKKNRILRLIQTVGVSNCGKVYCLNNILDDETRDEILDYVKNILDGGAPLVAYGVIEKAFESELENTLLADESILQKYLETQLSEYDFSAQGVTARGVEKKNIFECIKDVMHSMGGIASIDEISKALPGIKVITIKHVLGPYDDFSSCGGGKYFLVNEVDITENELAIIKGFIDKFIERDGVATAQLIYDALTAITSESGGKEFDLFDRYPYTNNKNAIRGLLIYHFSNLYDIHSDTISQKGDALKKRDIVRQFVNNTERFTADYALDYFTSRGGSEQTIFQFLCKDAVRIDQDNFINPNKVDFDIERVDNAIAMFMGDNDYIGLKEVDDYSMFGATNYFWNEFLFESYLTRFSKEYRLVNCYSKQIIDGGYSRKKAVGVIVKKGSRYMFLGDVLRGLLRKRHFETKEEFVDYLIKCGYIARERQDVIDAWEGVF